MFEFFISKPSYTKTLASNTLVAAVATGSMLLCSSAYEYSCGITKAGYDIQSGSGGCGGWSVAFDDTNQWIMITTSVPVKWKRIGTKGSVKSNQRTTSYYIMYSVDGSSWLDYKSKQIFSGNYDWDTKVEYDIEEFVAVSIRFHPVTWSGNIMMRIEAYYYEI